MHAYAFVANTLLPAQPAQGGFEEAPSERSAERKVGGSISCHFGTVRVRA